MIEQLIREEIRNGCNCPKKFQLLDYGAIIFGLFLVLDGILRIKRQEAKGWGTAETIIGTIMTLTHSIKFFYAKKLGMR